MNRGDRRALSAIAVIGAAVFVVLTVLVTTHSTHGLDAKAFAAANDIRAPWLDHVAKVITQFGLLVIVGAAVLLAAAVVFRAGRRARAGALAIGGALAWVSVWITKWAVDRPRPPAPLVHTVGQSFPSGHAANSVGWLAAALALIAIIPGRKARIAIVALAGVVTVMVGLSRIYLRAHYASDVMAGEAIAVTMFALAALGLGRASPASGDAIAEERGQLAA